MVGERSHESVLFLNHSAAVGGASLGLLAIVDMLTKAHAEVTILGPEGPVAAQCRALGARVEGWDAPALYWLGRPVYSSGQAGVSVGYVLAVLRYPLVRIKALRKIRTHVRTHHVSVIHVNSLVLFPLARGLSRIATKQGIRVVWHVRELVGDRLPGWLRQHITGSISRSSDVVLAISEAVARSFGPAGNLVILPNELGDEWLDRSRSPIRGIGSVVVMAAPFLPGKGIEVFLTAARLVLLEHPEARFRLYLTTPALGGRVDRLLLGLATRMSPLARLVRAGLWSAHTCVLDDRIELVFGQVVTPSSYADCCIFVNPDDFGVSWGRAIMEAMCVGLPIVAAGSNAEFVVDGETGFLVPPGRADLIRDRVVTLIRDPALRQRLGDAAAERIARLLSGFHAEVLKAFGIEPVE